VRLASLLFEAAEHRKSRVDRANADLLARLMNDPDGQVFTNLLADRAYRTKDPERLVDSIQHLLDRLGAPRSMPALDRLAMSGIRVLGPSFPRTVARAVIEKLRERTRQVILAAEEPALSRHLAERRERGVRMNVNWLGEAVLGEAEAEARVRKYEELLARPDVEALSVKLSNLSSQVRPLAWEASLSRLRPRLGRVYRAALEHRFVKADGLTATKLVTLDMEAYRDLELTVALFREVLEQPEFKHLRAGIALQAYLPDSYGVLRELTEWALARVERGGAPIRVRIVKGANLAAESVESSVRGFTLPIYGSKAEVDANYKRMVEFACRPEHLVGVELGIASHNVFDLAFGLVLRARAGASRAISFELLEGMAEPLRVALSDVARDVLLYAPVVEERAMQSAIAYLIRRLDENTSEENFLRHAFEMRVGDAHWKQQERRFLEALELRHQVSERPRRTALRPSPPDLQRTEAFENEPDTDFTLRANRAWILAELTRQRDRGCFSVPIQVAGVERDAGPSLPGFDPSRPGVVPYQYAVATPAEIEDALACAEAARRQWGHTRVEQRSELLARVADGLRRRRGELIAAMVLDAGKRIEEADAEVSEAIDFAEYYRRSAAELTGSAGLVAIPKGVALVTAPWNFPLAIPAGGTFAALATGNAVLLKPAPETPWVAALLARIAWDAGIPKQALQLVTCEDEVASRLVQDERVDVVILTGGTGTAQLFQELRPDIDLLAETGGKNAVIVTASADRDLAIVHAVQSAFGHAGQKCSATSLLVCEAEVYDDPAFRDGLRDAVQSLPVGPAWDPDSVVTPLIHPPSGALLRSLRTLDEGESWLVEPKPRPDNPRLWSPGVKLGVQEGSFTHQTELFGPLLGVMRAENLEEALRIANGTPYGLTAGLMALDEREQATFLEHQRAGNLYVNRGTTGAIVQRQPFGGQKASSFGPGAKAGGPNYVAQLVRFEELEPGRGVAELWPEVSALVEALSQRLTARERMRLGAGARDFARALEHHFGRDHEPAELIGQVNVFRYRPLSGLIIRAASGTLPGELALALAGALTCESEVAVSLAPAVAAALPELFSVPALHIVVESAAQLTERLEALAPSEPRSEVAPAVERIRCVGQTEAELRRVAQRLGVHLADEPPLAWGRWELRHYVREQSVSVDTHRYGNLSGERLAPLGRPPAPSDAAQSDTSTTRAVPARASRARVGA
jgi:RHH-type proline utilization regulon transcriptional repressor/proline dehydrogenase/delta 1-pyrroline-5-carboxylate dehydrogenase